MTDVMVVSHHRKAGGTPLDSFWFSQDACREKGLLLWFVWTGSSRIGLRALLRSEYVIFDGIYSLTTGYASIIYRLAKVFRKKIAIYWHETEWHASRAMKHQIVRRVVADRHLMHFHVCSAGKQMLIDQYGVEEANVRILQNITDDRVFRDLGKYDVFIPNWFAVCGVACERKGTDLFVEIAKRVSAVCPDAKFFWIGPFGDGEYSMASLVDQIRSEGLEHNVVFTGAVTTPALLLSRMQCVMLTSRDDPMPKVLMEAMALGKKVVSFDMGGVRELLCGMGTLISVGDVSAFSEALVVRDSEESHALGVECRRLYYEQYTPEAFAARLSNVLSF